jgi:hypothetical protein
MIRLHGLGQLRHEVVLFHLQALALSPHAPPSTKPQSPPPLSLPTPGESPQPLRLCSVLLRSLCPQPSSQQASQQPKTPPGSPPLSTGRDCRAPLRTPGCVSRGLVPVTWGARSHTDVPCQPYELIMRNREGVLFDGEPRAPRTCWEHGSLVMWNPLLSPLGTGRGTVSPVRSENNHRMVDRHTHASRRRVVGGTAHTRAARLSQALPTLPQQARASAQALINAPD